MCGLTNVQKIYNQQNHDIVQFDQPELADHEWGSKKAVIKGTIAHITAIFGFTLAVLVIQDIYNSNNKVSLKLYDSLWQFDILVIRNYDVFLCANSMILTFKLTLLRNEYQLVATFFR
jgi:hypothetical protein